MTAAARHPRESRAPTASWEQLLIDAIHTPGRIHAAYQAFHAYSFANQLLALGQCTLRGLEPGPISTYRGWTEKGRQVRLGERALTLCQPLVVRRAGRGAVDE